uniref:FAS1 domain-containing protein n=1 Tax=Glossina austeni TaxID=7395 RepID=A0A1A9V0C7_GLOAU
MPTLIIWIWTLLCLMALTRCREVEESILENIKDSDADYYKQAQTMQTCPGCEILSKMRHTTFFVPQLRDDADFDPYVHMAHGIIEEKDFTTKTKWLKVPSHYPGGYFLQIVKIDNKKTYVNGQEATENKCIPVEVKPTQPPKQATKKPKRKKLVRQTSAESTRKEKEQCLYKIKEPIEPLRLKDDGMDEKYKKYKKYANPNPNAWEFIRNFESYKLTRKTDLSYYRDRLVATRMADAYEQFGIDDQDRNFFVPTNDAFFRKKHYAELIDRIIIRNHIVDFGYLFPHATSKGEYSATAESMPVILKYDINNTLTWSRNFTISESHPRMNESNPIKILLTVFVSNGIVNIIDGVIDCDSYPRHVKLYGQLAREPPKVGGISNLAKS